MFNLTKVQKQVVLAIKIIIFGLLSWFFLYQLLYSGRSLFLILSIIGFLFLGISICLGTLLINKKAILYLAFGLFLLSFFIFFRGGEIAHNQIREALYYFVVLFFIFIALLGYKWRVRHEVSTRTNLNFWRIFKRGLPLVFTLTCLLIALAYYFSPSLGGTSETEFQIPRGLFNTALKPLSGLIQTRLPLYSPDMSIDELLTMFSFASGDGISDLSFTPSPDLYKIIQSKGIAIETLDLNQVLEDPEIASFLKEEIKKKTESLSPAQLAWQRAAFSDKLGIEIDEGETLDDILYKLANSQIGGVSGTFQQYIPIALAIGLFFSLRILVIVLIPIVVLFSWLVIKILIAVDFIKINTKSIKTEVMEL